MDRSFIYQWWFTLVKSPFHLWRTACQKFLTSNFFLFPLNSFLWNIFFSKFLYWLCFQALGPPKRGLCSLPCNGSSEMKSALLSFESSFLQARISHILQMLSTMEPQGLSLHWGCSNQVSLELFSVRYSSSEPVTNNSVATFYDTMTSHHTYETIIICYGRPLISG